MPVVDASVLVAAAVDNGIVGTWAEWVIAQGGLLAPHLVFAESANALRRLESATALGRLESTRLDGIDHRTVHGTHLSMIRNISKESSRIPPAVPLIIEYLE